MSGFGCRARLGYPIAAGFVALVGWVVGWSAGVSPRGSAVAMCAAWLVQVGAFLPLARALAAGENATRPWIAGMGVRGGALLLAWPAAALGFVTREEAAAFGIGLAALIVLEAVWLATIPLNPGSNDE